MQLDFKFTWALQRCRLTQKQYRRNVLLAFMPGARSHSSSSSTSTLPSCLSSSEWRLAEYPPHHSLLRQTAAAVLHQQGVHLGASVENAETPFPQHQTRESLPRKLAAVASATITLCWLGIFSHIHGCLQAVYHYAFVVKAWGCVSNLIFQPRSVS